MLQHSKTCCNIVKHAAAPAHRHTVAQYKNTVAASATDKSARRTAWERDESLFILVSACTRCARPYSKALQVSEAATASAFAQSRTMKLSMGTISLNKFPHVCLTHGHSARMAILGRPCRMAELGLDLLHQFLRASALVVREACSEQGSCE